MIKIILVIIGLVVFVGILTFIVEISRAILIPEEEQGASFWDDIKDEKEKEDDNGKEE